MPWFVPRPQLDDVEQIPFLDQTEENPDKNFWLKGFAGSGKSVLLIHCLIDEKNRNPTSKVIIVLYTHSLIDMIKEGIPDELGEIPVVTFQQFRFMQQRYDLILIDEIQDIDAQTLTNFREKLGGNGRLIVAGDMNQSIYDNAPSSDEISEILGLPAFGTEGIEYRLNRIYRISRRIRDISAPFCEDQDAYKAAQVMEYNANISPNIVHADNPQQEIEWLWMSAKEYAQAEYVPVILIANHKSIRSFLNKILVLEDKPVLHPNFDYNQINSHFRNNHLNIQYLGNQYGSFEAAHDRNLISVMTYHSAKGLDFKTVFIPFLNSDYIIWKNPVIRARNLFFVALTRSREQLHISFSGDNPHPFVTPQFISQCQWKEASDEIERMENPFNGDVLDEDFVVF